MKPAQPIKKKLTGKERKYAIAKIKGATNIDAYKQAGYAIAKPNTMKNEASIINKRPHIQAVINEALERENLTPELAVSELKKIVVQDKEIGAKRLAIRDTLELHGWRKDDRPTLSISVKNAFFTAKRDTEE